MANDKLVNLLYYTDKDPLSHEDLTQEQIQNEIFEKLIKIVPRVGPKETAHSVVVVRISRGRGLVANSEFKNVIISIETFVPMTQWIIKDTNLRPFAIMGYIDGILNNSKLTGIGTLNFLSAKELVLNEEFSGYCMFYQAVHGSDDLIPGGE